MRDYHGKTARMGTVRVVIPREQDGISWSNRCGQVVSGEEVKKPDQPMFHTESPLISTPVYLS